MLKDAPDWPPILEGALADRARATERAIGEALLERLEAEDETDRADTTPTIRADLPNGVAGQALLFGYLHRAGHGERYLEACTRCIDRAVDAVAELSMTPAFLGGFPGIAWAVQHVQGTVFGSTDADLNEPIDAALLRWLDQSPWRWEYDLVSGLVGIGVYALDRVGSPSGRPLLEAIVDRLAGIAEPSGDGLAWRTPAHLLPDQQRKACPNGYYNLGMAHGIPGIIALLGEIVSTGIAAERAGAMLQGAVEWMMAHRLPRGSGSNYAYWLAADQEAVPARSAWCYGDPGVAVALLRAGRFCGHREWERVALDIAWDAARRPVEQTGVVDAGLCHGAAGLGHIFNRLYHATGDTALGDAARLWFERALEMRRPTEGIAGFLTRKTDGDGKAAWIRDPGVVTGAAGIGLSLLAATSTVAPAWDRMMLMSIPGRGRGEP